MATTLLEKLLTRPEAADLISQSIRTVDANIANGNLKIVRIGRSIRIKPSELERFIAAREGGQNSKRKGGRA